MNQPTAVLDACVLYPAELRNLFMYLALSDLFRARWSDAIHDEWMRAVLETRSDVTRHKLERTRNLMNTHVRDCLVTGYEDLIPTLQLPDPDDRHVLAAAITARANVIVTFNLKDFPATALTPHGIEAQHPDVFVSRLLDIDATAVHLAIQRQRASLKNPPLTVDELLAIFEQCGLPQTVALLRAFADLL